MILLLTTLAVALTLGFATRGSLVCLARARLRAEGVLVASLLIQLLGPILVPAQSALPGAALLWVLWIIPGLVVLGILLLNRGDWGLRVAALGIAFNMLVVLANGGMPVQVHALDPEQAAAIMARLGASWLHVPASPSSRYVLLADVVPILGPAWFRGVVSLGDAFLACGIGHFIFTSMHRGDAQESE